MPMSKVMIVEDCDDLREAMADMLRLEGYRVEEARNGQEAYDMLEHAEEKPGLILLDLMMPVMSGPELIVALEKDPKLADLPIVIVSAAIESINTGAVKGALKKPVPTDVLLRTVDAFC